MVTIVVFWAAVMCVLFFLLGTIFKGISSAFTGFMESGGFILAIGFLGGLAALVLYLIYAIVHGIITEGLGSVFGTIIIALIVFGLIGGIIGGLGSIVLSIALTVAEYILIAMAFMLDGATSICEKAYNHFLLVIYKRLDRC